MRSIPRAAMALLLAVQAAPLLAAGGHHAVDDAQILEPRRCEAESWFQRFGAPSRLLHGEAACRVGPVELELSSEYERQRGDTPGSQTTHGVKVKWVTELGAAVSAGLSVAPQWQARARPRWQATTAVALLSWQATDSLALHANAGRDFVRKVADQGRGGVSADWDFGHGWKVMAERYREEGGHFARAGVRWEPATDWTVDLSRAVRLSGAGESSWTIALKREFGR